MNVFKRGNLSRVIGPSGDKMEKIKKLIGDKESQIFSQHYSRNFSKQSEVAKSEKTDPVKKLLGGGFKNMR